MTDSPDAASSPPSMSTAEWAADGSQRWSAVADRVEQQIAPVSDVLFTAAALEPGQRVLDVGCGRGPSTRRAAAAVGPSGSVVGLDVSETLVAEARSLDAQGAVEWVVGDAQRHDLPADHFDVVISRFGVMFFDDLVEAFANLRAATAPGGRLCVAVWQTRDRSEIMALPLRVAAEAAAAAGHPIDLPDPDSGPFALGDDAVVHAVLTAAGWEGVTFEPHELAMYAGGPGPVDAAVDIGLTMGPLRIALEGADDETRATVRAAVTEALAVHHDGTGVALGGAIAIVRARRPAAQPTGTVVNAE